MNQLSNQPSVQKSDQESNQESRQHRVLTHRFELAMAVAPCQRLFTPAGEELWVDGWRPRYVHPADGRTEAGMVFCTGEGAEYTLWCLVDYDTVAHRARYTRVTPGSRSAVVEVMCRAVAPERSEVQVSYMLTALTPAGAEKVSAMDEPAFAQMIDGWRTAIELRLPELADALIR